MNNETEHTPENWGFDVAGMDRTVDPRQDFYHYSVGTWVKKAEIPKDESSWNSFQELHVRTLEQQRSILDMRAASPRVAGTPEQMCFDFYDSADNMQRRNELGAQPMHEDRARVQAVETREELIGLLADYHVHGSSVFFNPYVAVDSKSSSTYIFHIDSSGLGMPDRDYYLDSSPEHVRVRTAYQEHIVRLLQLSGYSEDDARKRMEIVMRIETRFARATLDKVTLRDPHATYHKMTWGQLKELTPNVPWDAYAAGLGIPMEEHLLVPEPVYMQEVARVLADEPLDDLKAYFDWDVISDASGLLSQDFIDENFRYSQTLSGQEEMKPQWRRSLNSLNGHLGELFGQLYVAKYFHESAKKKIDTLVSDLFDAYEKRIRGLSWMSEETKVRAVEKLRSMRRKIGYPTKWRTYEGLVIRADDYYGNSERITTYEFRRNLNRLGTPVDKEEWFTPPQTVNAYYNPVQNEIVFPAGILQSPFFDPDADDAVNYGAIGAIIGHEMTHGFDDEGSKYDGDGNLNDWWTAEDRKRFDALGELLVEQYGAQTVEGISVNGKLTLGENIADLGGILIAFDAYQAELARTGRTDKDGFTPEQRFFLTIGQNERDVKRPETAKTQVLNDPHAPAHLRVNCPLQHVPVFYDAFGVVPGDGMYRADELRAHIW
ncbi:MAG: hypothetical protein RLZZ283_460 [Candidatus Parcubacteria bacterium]